MVDTPAIQYVVSEAASLGIRDVLLVTGRGKRSIEDHFDRSFELEHFLEAAGKRDELQQVQEISRLVDIHYVRQGEPRGLGHAVLAAQGHVGDEPFLVMLGDDIMDPSEGVTAGMVDLHAATGCSVVALKEVPLTEISQYGCARVEEAADGAVRIVEIVEKPDPHEAPSNLAVMGRYVLTPEIFEVLAAIPPGRGGEIQLTDAIARLIEIQPVYGFPFSRGRYDVGNKLDYLKATVEMAIDRPDLGPEFREFLARLVKDERI